MPNAKWVEKSGFLSFTGGGLGGTTFFCLRLMLLDGQGIVNLRQGQIGEIKGENCHRDSTASRQLLATPYFKLLLTRGWSMSTYFLNRSV
jgi:hypothetical protein